MPQGDKFSYIRSVF